MRAYILRAVRHFIGGTHAPHRRQRSRRGVTLIEIAVVLAIISILASIGGPLLTKSLPRWRTRRAAKEFAAAVEQARSLAIAQNVEYRILM